VELPCASGSLNRDLRTRPLRVSVLDPVSELAPGGRSEPQHRPGPVLGVTDECAVVVTGRFDAAAAVGPAVGAFAPAQAS